MLPALLVLVGLFALLFVARVGGARRYDLLRRWPALLFAGAALFALARGAIWPATLLAVVAVLAWRYWPRPRAPRATAAADEPGDAEARAALGVGANATAAEIRAAYRARMARAHPDRGGTHAEAARLTAARDRLLRRKR